MRSRGELNDRERLPASVPAATAPAVAAEAPAEDHDVFLAVDGEPHSLDADDAGVLAVREAARVLQRDGLGGRPAAPGRDNTEEKSGGEGAEHLAPYTPPPSRLSRSYLMTVEQYCAYGPAGLWQFSVCVNSNAWPKSFVVPG